MFWGRIKLPAKTTSETPKMHRSSKSSKKDLHVVKVPACFMNNTEWNFTDCG
jgi:hypothetical protein